MPNEIVEAKTQSEWTLAKEIYGTMIATLPFVIVLIVWGARVNERISMVEVRLEIADVTDRKREADSADSRRELLAKMDRLSIQVENLQQTVARLAARSDDVTPRRVQNIPDDAFKRNFNTR